MASERSDTAMQDDVDTISLAIQACDDQHRALAGQQALNRMVDEIKWLRAANAALRENAKMWAGAAGAIFEDVSNG